MFNWGRKKSSAAAGLVGIESAAEGLSLAQIEHVAGAPLLRRCLHESMAPSQHGAQLKRWVDAHGLAGCQATLVLPPSAYQLLLLDCPDVEAAELRDAMRWRVRELISEPLENVVVDAFTLPSDAYRGRSRMAYCAVLSRTVMLSLETLVREAGLEPVCIDIREMAFRNLGLLAGAEDLNIAVLRLSGQEGLITIQHGADLYMARRIEQGLQGAGDYAAVTLEIQRSLDYFESQLGKGYLNRLLLAPVGDSTAAVFDALSSGLAVNLQRLELDTLLAADDPQGNGHGIAARCLPAIGAALRQEAA